MTDGKQQAFCSITNSPDTLVRLGDYLARLYGLEEDGASLATRCRGEWEEFEFQVVTLMVAAWKLPDPHLIPYCQEFMKRWLPIAPRSPHNQVKSGAPFLECIEAATRLAGGFDDYQAPKSGVFQKLFGKSPGVAQLVGGKYLLDEWPLAHGKSDASKEERRVRALYDRLSKDELLQHVHAMRPIAFIARFAKCHPCPHMTCHFDWTSFRPEFARIVLADQLVPRTLGLEYPKSARESMSTDEVLAELNESRRKIKERRKGYEQRLKDFQEGKPRTPR